MDEHSLAVQKKQTIEVQNDKSEYVDAGYELTTKGKFLLTQGGAPNLVASSCSRVARSYISSLRAVSGA